MSSAATTQIPDLQNYIAGTWRPSLATEFVNVVNPATEETIAISAYAASSS